MLLLSDYDIVIPSTIRDCCSHTALGSFSTFSKSFGVNENKRPGCNKSLEDPSFYGEAFFKRLSGSPFKSHIFIKIMNNILAISCIEEILKPILPILNILNLHSNYSLNINDTQKEKFDT